MSGLIELLERDADQLGPAFQISWIELAALVFGRGLPHPQQCTALPGRSWRDRSQVSASCVSQVSVALRVRYISSLIRYLDRFFQLGLSYCDHLDRTASGIIFPVSGFLVHLSNDSLQCIDAVLTAFTSLRPVRTSNDLSRPFMRA